MGVTFGTKHSKNDYSLNYIHRNISSPVVKTVKVDIPLADGTVDLTDRLTGNSPRFDNRVITLGFEMRGARGTWLAQWSTIAKDIHGKVLDVKLDEDSNYYWHGRCSVGNLEDHGGSAGLTITVDAYPYKKKNTLTSGSTYSTLGAKTISIASAVAWPQFIITSGSITISTNGATWTITPTQDECPGLIWRNGSNSFTIAGSATSVRVKYREGEL